jgi:hypothetical protein
VRSQTRSGRLKTPLAPDGCEEVHNSSFSFCNVVQVAEKERLRPACGHAPLTFEKKNFPIPNHLQADVKASQDSLGKVAKLADLVALNVSTDGHTLVAIGSQKALDMAVALIDMHFGVCHQSGPIFPSRRGDACIITALSGYYSPPLNVVVWLMQSKSLSLLR